MIYWPRILKWQAGTCVLKMVHHFQFLSAQVFKWEFACNSRLVYHSIFVSAVDTSIRISFPRLVKSPEFFFRGNTFTDKRFSQTPQNLNFTRNSGYKALSRGQWAWRLADKITILLVSLVFYTQGTYFVFSSYTKTLILWPSIWHDTAKPEAVLVAYHWANFWGAVSFRQVLTNGAASSKACDLELVLTSKLVPCTLPVNSRPFTKRQLISWSQKLFYFH